MADPFFRGQNYADWLFAVLLQQAVDGGSDAQVTDVATAIGPVLGLERYASNNPNIPDLVLCITAEYLFVVSGSTQTLQQHIFNVLGSSQTVSAGIPGATSTYFRFAASTLYTQSKAALFAAAKGRKVVFIGFSLGSAIVTIMSAAAAIDGLVGAAVIVFASPRPGDPTFSDSIPGQFFQRFGVQNDPVPSVPPVQWAGSGSHVGLIPIPALVIYQGVSPAWYFDANNELQTGESAVPLVEVIASVLSGAVFTFHDHGFYARAVREHLPGTLPAAYEGYVRADLFDSLAPRILDPAPQWPWPRPWPTFPVPDPLPPPPFVWPLGGSLAATPQGVFDMASQIGIFIRDSSRQKGWEEVYYTNLGASASTMTIVTNTLLPLRQKMLAKPLSSTPGCEIYAARVSNVGTIRQSVFTRLQPTLTGSYNGPSLEGMATVEQSMAYLGTDASLLYKRAFHFRGVDGSVIADELISSNGASKWEPLVIGPGGFLTTFISNAGLVIHGGRPSGTAGIPITGATQVAPGSPIVISYGGPGLPPGSLFEIRGCRSAPLLNGRWQATGAMAANVLTLSGSSRYGIPAQMSGSVFPVTPTYVSVANTVARIGAGVKKTGRPPLSPRGRASARLRRR